MAPSPTRVERPGYPRDRQRVNDRQQQVKKQIKNVGTGTWAKVKRIKANELIFAAHDRAKNRCISYLGL